MTPCLRISRLYFFHQGEISKLFSQEPPRFFDRIRVSSFLQLASQILLAYIISCLPSGQVRFFNEIGRNQIEKVVNYIYRDLNVIGAQGTAFRCRYRVGIGIALADDSEHYHPKYCGATINNGWLVDGARSAQPMSDQQ